MYRQVEAKELSRSQFEAARLGFFQTLRRKRMSPQFIERHGEDLFAQACFEYSRQVAEGREIGDPPAWIVTCGWHRTVGLLETRDWRPRLVSTESIAEPSDQEDATPEGTFLAEDRRRKVREAVEELPDYQRRLLALSYFEGESVREAARRLRWTASKAQRAHEAAQKRVFEILGVDSTDELQLEVGLFAFLSVAAERGAGHTLPAGVEAVLDSAHRGVSELGDKADRLVHRPLEVIEHPSRLLSPTALAPDGRPRGLAARGPLRRLGDLGRRVLAGGVGEAGAVAAGEGGSRALEVCKGLAVCVIGGGALTGALIAGGHHHPGRTVAHKAPPARTAQSHDVPPRRAPVAHHVVVPVAPAPRGAGESAPVSSQPTAKPADRKPAVHTEPSRVESATPADETRAAHQETQEAEVEEQFRDLNATEQVGGESAPVEASSVTDAETTGAPPARSAPEPSPQHHEEEAQVAHQFRGLLE